jgi:hypothetical protein
MHYSSKIISTVGFYLCFVIGSSAQLPNYISSDRIEGFWSFTGDANDISGNGNHAVVMGPSLTTDRFGNANGAYLFDGIDDFIQSTNINLPDSGTLAVWVNPYLRAGGNNTWTYSAALVDKSIDSVGNSAYSMLYNDSVGTGLYAQVGWSGDNNNMVLPTTPQFMNLFNWQHCVFTFSNGVGKLYWNGCLVHTVVGLNSTSQNSLPILFGRSHFAPNANLFKGKLDDIGIWSRALSYDEIQVLYTGANVSGCRYPMACNYDPSSTIDDGTCVFPAAGFDCNGNCLDDTNQNDICDGQEIFGCMDSIAINYNENATWDDNSCLYGSALCGLGTIWDPISQTCIPQNLCPSDLTGDGVVNVQDLLLFTSDFGIECD